MKGRELGQIFYVTGGQHRRNAENVEEWVSFGRAQVFRIDAGSGELLAEATYESPREHRPDEPDANVVFKAGSINGDELHVCTQTEILTYRLPDLELVSCVSHPWFNDLHHVMANGNGSFLVAVTGLDLVVEISRDGEIVAEYPVPGGDTWSRFDRDADYRKVLTTKPHQVHPNYVFRHDGELWATRFVQRDAVRITGGPAGIEGQGEKLHDGSVVGDKVYLTSVDGHLVVADLRSGRTLAVHDFNAMVESDRILGWCRGLHVLDEDRVVVGFSRLRPTKIRENLQWVKFSLGLRENAGKLGTRLGCFNLARSRLEWACDLEQHGMNAVFSVLPA